MLYGDIYVTFVHLRIFLYYLNDFRIDFDFAYFKLELILKTIEWMDENDRMNGWMNEMLKKIRNAIRSRIVVLIAYLKPGQVNLHRVLSTN